MAQLISASLFAAAFSGGSRFPAIDDPRIIGLTILIAIIYFGIFKVTLTTIYIALMVIMLLSIMTMGDKYSGNISELYLGLAIMTALFIFLKVTKRL